MTMNPEQVEKKDDRMVLFMGEIPAGQEDKYRSPTDFELDMMLYEAENLTEKEYDSMSDEEFFLWQEEAKKIVKERMANNL